MTNPDTNQPSFEKEIESKKTLNNHALDSNEISFLKKQKEWLSELDTETMKKLFADIEDQNEKSLKWPKTSALLAFATNKNNFRALLKQLNIWQNESSYTPWGSKWYVMQDQEMYDLLNAFNNKNPDEKKMMVINILLAHAVWNWWKYTYESWNKTYGASLSSTWLKKSGWNMSITTIRMLHKFQSTDKKGESARSNADCIIWPRTIQQLFARAEISLWELNGTWEFSIWDEFETGYSSEKYSLNKASQIVTELYKREKNNPVNLTTWLLRVYNSIEEKDKTVFINYIKNIIGMDHIYGVIQKIADPTEKKRVKSTVESTLSQMPGFSDSYNVSWELEKKWILNEHLRPTWKVNKLKTIIEVWRVWEWYLKKVDVSNSLTDSDEEQALKDEVTNSLSVLESYYNGNKNNWDISTLDINFYVDKVFHYVSWKYRGNKNLKKIKQVFRSDNASWKEGKDLDSRKTNLLEKIRKIDGDNRSNRYSWDAIINELDDDISGLQVEKSPWYFDKSVDFNSWLNDDLANLDGFLAPKGKLMGGLIDSLSGVTTRTETYTSRGTTRGWPVISTNTVYVWKDRVKQYLIDNWFSRDVASGVWEKLYKKYQDIEKQTKSVKSDTEKAIKSKYTKEKNKLTTQINILETQMETVWEEDSHYEEYAMKKRFLQENRRNYIDFLNGWVLKQIKKDADGNMIFENGKFSSETVTDGDGSITLSSMWDDALREARQYAFSSIAEKVIWVAILEEHEDAVDAIEEKVKNWWWTTDEKKLAMIANIEGVGHWRSDGTYNTVVNVTKEIIIEVAICVASMWVWTIVSAWARAAYRGWRAILQASRFANRANKVNKILNVWKHINKLKFVKNWKIIATNIAKKTPKVTKVATNIANKAPKAMFNMITEWTWFHMSSVILHNAVSWQNLMTGFNPFWYEIGPDGEKLPNRKWYTQSIAFLWVLKWLWKPIQNLNAKMVNWIMWEKLSTTVMAKILKNTGSIWWEMWSLMATEQILSLGFEWEFKSMTWKDFIHMFGMIIGLRMHGWITKKLWWEKSISERIDQWSIKKFSKNWKEWELTLKNKETGEELVIKESEINIKNAKLNKKIENSNKEIQKIDANIKISNQKIKELEAARKEYREKTPIDKIPEFSDIIAELWLAKWHIFTKTESSQKYKIFSAKDGKITLVENITNWPKSTNKIEITSIEQMMKDWRRIADKKTKIGGKTKQKTLEDLYANSQNILKTKPWAISKKIKDLQTKKSQLEAEVNKIKLESSNPALNQYFVKNANQLNWKKIWVAWVKYTGSIKGDWTLSFKKAWNQKLPEQVNWKTNEHIQKYNQSVAGAESNFTVSSFKQLFAKWEVLVFNPNTWKNSLGMGEAKDIQQFRELKSRETSYLNTRSTTLVNKQAILKQVNADILIQQGLHKTATARQQRAKTRADGAAKFTKEIGKEQANIQKLEAQKSEHQGNNQTRVKKIENNNTEYTSQKRWRHEQGSKKKLDELTVDNLVKSENLPESIKKRQEAKPEYDLNWNPKWEYKKSIQEMQKYLKENNFYKEWEISTADWKIGKHTSNALDRFGGKLKGDAIKKASTKQGVESFNQSKDGVFDIKYKDWSREIWPRKNGKLEWKWKIIDRNGDIFKWNFKEWRLEWQWTVTFVRIWAVESGIFNKWSLVEWKRTFKDGSFSEWIFEWPYIVSWKIVKSNWDMYSWDFRFGNLRSGKITTKDWKTIKEIYQWKELQVAKVLDGKSNVRLNSKGEVINKNPLKIMEYELQRHRWPNSNWEYMAKSKEARKYFSEWLANTKNITPDNFTSMMKELNRISAYKTSEIARPGELRGSVTGGAREWADVYTKRILDQFNLWKATRAKGKPTEYANITEFNVLFKDAANTLQKIAKITKNTPGKNNKELIGLLSDYHHTMCYLRPFGNVNNSMSMNQINFFLKANNMKAISQWHLDHLATRTTKKQYREIFKENLKKELPTSAKGTEQDLIELGIDKNSDQYYEIMDRNREQWDRFGDLNIQNIDVAA